LAKVAAAGNLAIVSRSRECTVRGLDGARASLAGTEVGNRSEKQRMIAPLARFIDWSILKIGGAALLQSMWRESVNARDLKLEQAIRFLKGPDFIPAESEPAELDFIPSASGGYFGFPTPRPCEFAENNVVHGRLYRCADAWQERPVIILLHGLGDFPGHQFGFHLIAQRCHRAGFNAATLELPYHFQRRPRQYGPLNIMYQYSAPISSDYLWMAETYAQAVAEIRSLSGWFLAEGCPAVALVEVRSVLTWQD
jgi:hypothetical protein